MTTQSGVKEVFIPRSFEALMFDFSQEEKDIVREVFEFCPHKAQLLILQLAKRHRESKNQATA